MPSNIVNAMINFRKQGLNSRASFLLFMIFMNPKSPHILNASSNLLGLCFIVLTSLRLLKVEDRTAMSILATVAITLFMTSTLLSFLSLKRESIFSKRMEKIADYVFIAGTLFLYAITLLIALNLIG